MIIGALAAILLLASVAQADVWEGFEAADNAWKFVESDADVRVLSHERTWREAHGGHACEHLRLAIGAGNHAYLAFDIPPARAIAELKLGLWLKSDRVGPQLYARIVLPRTREPRGDHPVTMLIPGPSYSEPGSWQALAIGDVPALIERQARVLRAQLGRDVDTREAFVDKIVLDAYSEPGLINLWVDDLEVAGQVALTIDEGMKDRGARAAAYDDPAADAAAPQIALDGSIIQIDGRPTALRIIEHNGESLEWLQEAGFNVALLREPPSAELLADAKRVGMRLIAPPELEDSRPIVTAAHVPVIAWSLGMKLSPLDVESSRSLARDLRLAERSNARPLIAGSTSSLSAYSRCANLLFVEPPALGGSFEMADYAAWFAERPRLVRSGTPLVAVISSEPPDAAVAQFDALRPHTLLPHTLDYEQLRLLTFTAAASGVRGICFRSQTRLDGQNVVAQQRADILRLICAELKLIEPWLAAGASGGEIDVDDPAVQIDSLRTDRARLLIVRRYAAGQQWVLGAAEKDRVTLVMPGTPSSTHAYRLSTLGMEPLAHKRVTGGMQLTVESAGVCALVVLTQDPLVMNRVARDLSALQTKQARLHYDITMRKFETALQAVGSLPNEAYPPGIRTLEQANGNLQQALRLIAANDQRGGQKFVLQASSQIASVERGHWQAATRAFASPVESALCTHFALLPAHYEIAERLRTANWTNNVLAGGDMESLDALVQAGWRHQRDPNIAVESAVELAPQPHGGQSSLHIQAFAPKPEEAPAIVESAPVWIITPPLKVQRNKMVRIRGFIRTSPSIEGTRDGVLLFDSIAGRALAERIPSSAEWRQFTLYRAVPEDTSLTLTIALAGLGEAWIDDLEISLLDIPTPREPAGPSPSLAPTNRSQQIPAPRTQPEELPPPQARGWWPLRR